VPEPNAEVDSDWRADWPARAHATSCREDLRKPAAAADRSDAHATDAGVDDRDRGYRWRANHIGHELHSQYQRTSLQMTPHVLPMARPGERGLSLLELIVVLAILSLVLVAVAPLVTQGHRGAMIDVAARDVALALRETRAAAIYGNRGVTFTLDG